MTLAEFYDLLEKHDWFYDFAEGNSYYRGKENQSKLVKLASAGGPEFQALMRTYSEYVSSGPAFGTEKKPKPERPGGPKLTSSQDPF